MRAVLASLLVLAGCGCGKSSGPVSTAQGTAVGSAVSVVIGAQGGSVSSADGGVRLEIPAGALTQATTFTVQQITHTAPDGRQEAWRLGPEGTTFAQPATLRFQASGSLPALGIGTQDSKGYWHWLDGVTRDEATQTLSVTTTHLSDWSLLEGVQLKPLSATVKPGTTQTLEVVDCVVKSTAAGELADLMASCDDVLAPLTPITGWSVNGQTGGNATVGTVAGSANAEATFTAPGQAPNPPTVAVSVAVPSDSPRYAKAIVVSQLTIGDPKSLHGTFTIDAQPINAGGATISLSGTMTLTLSDDGIDETNYELSGTVKDETKSFTFGTSVCTLKSGQESKAITKQGAFKVRKQPVLAVRWGYVESFDYQCTGSVTALPVMIYFFTGTGTACTAFSDVPVSNATSPSGTFTSSCGYGPATAKWTVGP